MGSSRSRNSTRATKPRSVKSVRKSRRKPAVPSMPKASAASILLDVRQRLEVARAVVAVTAAGLRSQVDCDQEAATTLTRCVCDVIDEQRDWLHWVASRCLPLTRTSVDPERVKADMKLARAAEESRP